MRKLIIAAAVFAVSLTSAGVAQAGVVKDYAINNAAGCLVSPFKPHWYITAAHCTVLKQNAGEQDTLQLPDGRKFHGDIFAHPVYDVSLIRTQEDAGLENETLSFEDVPEGSRVKHTLRDRRYGGLSEHIYHVDSTVVNNEYQNCIDSGAGNCGDKFNAYHSVQDDGKFLIGGDSGGPVYNENNDIIGVNHGVRHLVYNGQTHPDKNVIAPIAPVQDWINDTVDSNPVEVAPPEETPAPPIDSPVPDPQISSATDLINSMVALSS